MKTDSMTIDNKELNNVEATEEQIQDIKENGYNEDNGTKWIRDIQSYKN